MKGIQVIAIIFALGMVYYSFLHYKRKEFNLLQVLFWEIIWGVFIFITIFPNTVNHLTEKLGIARAMDLFMITGFIVVTFLTFYSYAKVKKLEKKLEDYVRKEALRDLDNNK